MAQWLGQFSGKTHASKVAELELSLRTAVESVTAVDSGQDRARKVKVVHRLARRLLSARLHMMKSRLAAATERQEGQNVDALKLREAHTREAGVEGILSEFGVNENP